VLLACSLVVLGRALAVLFSEMKKKKHFFSLCCAFFSVSPRHSSALRVRAVRCDSEGNDVFASSRAHVRAQLACATEEKMMKKIANFVFLVVFHSV